MGVLLPSTLNRDADDISYSLEHIVVAASSAGYALLGQVRGSWFRPRDLESSVGLDRSTIRKHYADPMSELGLLERREARGTPRPTYEYTVTSDGEALRSYLDEILHRPPHTDTAASTPVVVVTADDAKMAEDLATELEQVLTLHRRAHAVALQLPRR